MPVRPSTLKSATYGWVGGGVELEQDDNQPMPKNSFNRLTRRQVETSKPGRVADGGGLVLQTSKSQSRSWLFVYRWGDKRPRLA